MVKEPEQPTQVQALVEAAQHLMVQVDALGKEGGVQFTSLAKRSRSNRRLGIIAISGLVLDVVLSVVLSIGLIQVRANETDIHRLTDRLNTSQTVTRQQALCPLYQIFLDSRTPAGRAAAPDKAKYDHAFEVIQKGYDVLGCASFIAQPSPKPPGT